MRPGLETVLLTVAIASSATLACRKDAVDPERQAEAQQNYRAMCARCHGQDGRGGVPVGGVSPRNFRDRAFQNSRSDEDLARAIRDGKGAMPAFRAVYDDRQIRGLVEVIRGFR